MSDPSVGANAGYIDPSYGTTDGVNISGQRQWTPPVSQTRPQGSDGTPVDPASVPPAIDWSQFTTGLNELGQTLGSRLDALRGDVQKATEPPAPPPVDLETLSQSDLVAHIVGTISKVIDEKLAATSEPLLRATQDAQTIATQTQLNAVIDRMQAQHKDFADWKPEMIALAKEHPTLDIPKLYALSKSLNPQKAQELHLKHNPPPPRPAPRFGGLTPTGTSTNGAMKPLSPREAGQEAYREVAERWPGMLRALEDL